MTQDEKWMRAALAQARVAERKDEVPVGAVIVLDGKVIARGHNLRETGGDPCAHAELLAIRRAAKKVGGWRLCGCTLYVTLEPCPMCAGAIVNSRIDRVVFGAWDPKAGVYGSLMDMNAIPFNHHPEVEGGVLQEQCSGILKEYFARKRLQKKAEKQARADAEEY